MHLDAYELLSFKLDMMISTTKLCIVMPVCITLTFTQSQNVTRKHELVQLFCYKVAWSSQNFSIDWLSKGDDCKQVL